ncbi:MAG: nuclear transport factor 2 family protein [Candidatus Hydrogenedentes bacterium]|nr:nuclear transport factor 2 family protein [Candidatus Hydrogenedentota bacterium]
MQSKAFLNLCICLFAMAVAVGCATTGGGDAAAQKPADDKAAITKVLNDWGAALATKNIDTIVTFYSDSFSDSDGRGKPEMKGFLQEVIDAGYLDGAKVDLTTTVITVNGDQATATPVNLSGDMGAIPLSLTLKKEAAGWRIASSSQG